MVRQTAQILFDALVTDTWPSTAAVVDFGLDGWNGTDPKVIYAAFKKAFAEGKISPESLDNVLGDGPKLTELLGTKVMTVWDEL